MVVIFWFSYQQMHGDFDPYEMDLIHCKGLNSLGGGRTRALPFSISRGGRLEFLETGHGLQLQVFGTVFNISFGGHGANKPLTTIA